MQSNIITFYFILNTIISVADPNYFDTDPDPDPACHFHADTDPDCHFDVDPDPTFHFDVDPDPSFEIKAQN
jgi:hypothetical protein